MIETFHLRSHFLGKKKTPHNKISAINSLKREMHAVY